MRTLLDFAKANWQSAFEILILAVAIYFGYLYFRGTRGAKVLTGFALLFLTLTLLAQVLDLKVISQIIRSLSAFLAIALVVIFQPELRRALAAVGGHPIFSSNRQKQETLTQLTDIVFALAGKQLGSLIALERDTNIRNFTETGVDIDCKISRELVLTIFHPKTPLHDGGMVINNDRIVAAACIFPVSAREDLDRSMGLRHRAALGVSEESDAIAIVTSEETAAVSICHRGRIERNFNPDTFRARINELLSFVEENEEAGDEFSEKKAAS
ncbi:MAG TPA: diadenylate cyclase CdaA [Chthoniobacterales bacterium]|jgi:diadenylate cyclase